MFKNHIIKFSRLFNYCLTDILKVYKQMNLSITYLQINLFLNLIIYKIFKSI